MAAAQGPAYDLRLKREVALVVPALAMQGWAWNQERKPVQPLTVAYDPGSLWRLDLGTVGRWDPAAHRGSNMLFGATVAATFTTALLTRGDAHPAVPTVILFETALLSAAITDVVKNVVHRPRPYLYDQALLPVHQHGANDHLSFWSGHTANTAALTFGTAWMVQRSDASPTTKTITWATAAVVPAAMGYLRVRAGRHFPTDVLTGYAFGALVGWAVPYLHGLSPQRRTP